MSWITRLRPKLNKFLQPRDTPDNLWHKCRGCGKMIFRKDFLADLSVCQNCGHHERVTASERLGQVFDDGACERLPLPAVPEDPLKFKDQKKYVDRLKAARASTGQDEAVAVAVGKIGGMETVVFVQDFSFMGGSMGLAVGEAFLTAARAAVQRRCPMVAFTAAGGARMQEGILSLMQMPRTTVGIQELKEARLPYIVVLTDPTTGGVTASYAMLGDIQLAEPGALIGFAGQRVIEQTIREKLPEGFQRSEYLYEHGMVDAVVHRRDMAATLARLIGMLMMPKPASRQPALAAS
ncbi:MAG TPA: acetyl-CoA carboxylase, carboxyltransferase subunit beta [Pedomonas sp.]|uniref:acetyl-CoA carboxylase, carboxyltransferase subunit beta n=1 Tax=Pedomonas sp. TaxID=2976421 RepID=UPI002F3EAA59